MYLFERNHISCSKPTKIVNTNKFASLPVCTVFHIWSTKHAALEFIISKEKGFSTSSWEHQLHHSGHCHSCCLIYRSVSTAVILWSWRTCSPEWFCFFFSSRNKGSVVRLVLQLWPEWLCIFTTDPEVGASPHGSASKESSCNAGDPGDPYSIPGREDLQEEGMATRSSIPAWKIPWTEEAGGPQLKGPQRVGHDWAQHRTEGWWFDFFSSLNTNLPIRSNHMLGWRALTNTCLALSQTALSLAPTVCAENVPGLGFEVWDDCASQNPFWKQNAHFSS